MATKVAVALSGGIDSAVAAMILRDQGYQVSGVTLQLQADSHTGIEAAANVAKKLGVGFTVLDLKQHFSNTIILPFCREYATGKTPNPCVWCNRFIKFGALSDYVRNSGLDYLATGHYSRIESHSGIFKLFKSPDTLKDQSYFLYTLHDNQLASIMFPLGTYTKVQVRDMARSNRLDEIVLPEESQDICFIQGNDYQQLVASYCQPISGEIVDSVGTKLGSHQGLFRYTVGQRHGLGIASSRRLYVKELDSHHNRIVLGTYPELKCSEFFVANLSWVAGSPPSEFEGVTVKTRYKGAEVPCCLAIEEPETRVDLSQPLWAIAPGQSAVFYRGAEVLGGGIITRSGDTSYRGIN